MLCLSLSHNNGATTPQNSRIDTKNGEISPLRKQAAPNKTSPLYTVGILFIGSLILPKFISEYFSRTLSPWYNYSYGKS